MNGNSESPEETTGEEAIYDVHIKLERKMQATLKGAAMLAYKLGDTNKPELAELMNLFIG